MTGTFEGVGSLQFSPDNKLAYAYSGLVAVNNSETTLLEIKTTSEYISARTQFFYADNGTDPYVYKIYLDNVIIIQYRTWGTTDTNGEYNNPPKDNDLIIPPFTTVKFTAENLAADTNENQLALFTGKVFGAIEQINLESITDDNKWAEKGPF